MNFTTPGPAHYDPDYKPKMNMLHKSEMPGYSIPKAMSNKEAQQSALLRHQVPGPGQYESHKLPIGQQKIILGGSVVAKETKDNGVPGPGNYYPKSQDSIQGFVMTKATN